MGERRSALGFLANFWTMVLSLLLPLRPSEIQLHFYTRSCICLARVRALYKEEMHAQSPRVCDPCSAYLRRSRQCTRNADHNWPRKRCQKDVQFLFLLVSFRDDQSSCLFFFLTTMIQNAPWAQRCL